MTQKSDSETRYRFGFSDFCIDMCMRLRWMKDGNNYDRKPYVWPLKALVD